MEVGRTYRLRLCQGSASWALAVTVEGHNLTVIAKDGSLIRPVQTSTIMMDIGERYDVLVKPCAAGNYSIHFHSFNAAPGQQLPDGKGGSFNATIRVTDGGPWCGAAANATTAGEGADEAAPFVRVLHAATSQAAQTLLVPLNGSTTPPPEPTGDHVPAVLGGNMMGYAWFINGIAYVYPSPALIYLSHDLNKYAPLIPAEGKPVAVKVGAVVDVYIPNLTKMWHPLHLHAWQPILGYGRGAERHLWVVRERKTAVTVRHQLHAGCRLCRSGRPSEARQHRGPAARVGSGSFCGGQPRGLAISLSYRLSPRAGDGHCVPRWRRLRAAGAPTGFPRTWQRRGASQMWSCVKEKRDCTRSHLPPPSLVI